MGTYAEQLSDFVSRLKFKDIPVEVIDKAKLHLLDIIGISLACTELEYAKIVAQVMSEQGGKPECTVIGFGDMLPVSTAVLINSWTSGRRVFRVEMHAPGICAEAEHEGKGHLYADGDTEGTAFDTCEVAGSDELFVFAGFQAKNREFIDAVKKGKQPPSHFADAVKTMEVADRMLALALLEE